MKNYLFQFVYADFGIVMNPCQHRHQQIYVKYTLKRSAPWSTSDEPILVQMLANIENDIFPLTSTIIPPQILTLFHLVELGMSSVCHRSMRRHNLHRTVNMVNGRRSCLWDSGIPYSTWRNLLIIGIYPAANVRRQVLMSPPYQISIKCVITGPNVVNDFLRWVVQIVASAMKTLLILSYLILSYNNPITRSSWGQVFFFNFIKIDW